jgi:hypothetical protein
MNDFIHQKEQVGPYQSVVVTINDHYFSPYSSGTLKKRSQGLFQE